MKRAASRVPSPAGRPAPRAEILVIGKEIVTGHRQDANVLVLARYLVTRGIEVIGVRMVPDDPLRIAEAVKAARGELLVACGGLGSTRDDVTLPAVAKALGRSLVVDPGMKARVVAKLRRRGVAWAPRHRAFSHKPAGAEALPNSAGLAEGILLPGRPAVLLLPGVPAELETIVKESLGPALDRLFPGTGAPGNAGAPTAPSHVIGVAGMRETEIEDACLDLPEFKQGTVSILPSAGVVQLVLRGDALRDEVVRRLGHAVFTTRGQSLEEVVFEALRTRGETLATAESCTGGLLAGQLTELPGISTVYRGGVVAYADEAKRQLLGVSSSLLSRHGAVSGHVAVAMAVGARRQLEADWAISVTGIAGPGGGSTRKPVGLVHVAVAGRRGTRTCRLVLGGNRAFIRRQAVRRALDLLRRSLMRNASTRRRGVLRG